MRALGLVLLLVVTLSGCAEVPPSPLARDAVASLRLGQIDVRVAEGAEIAWGNAEHEFVVNQRAASAPRTQRPIETGSIGDPAAADAAETAELVNSPEGKVFVRGRIVDRIEGAVAEAFKGRMEAGARPVRLEITVTAFYVPSAIQRVVVGGQPGMAARVVLRDAAAGAELAVREKLVAAAFVGNGIGGVLIDRTMEDHDVRLARNFAVGYRDWLLNEAP